ncbi:uncharacterized protein GLRG_08116 [Colletotrichum graminicola M1.001]|uniref:Uncharacterized protein n=1 Tax=Colletotrichum graminicola (strain M1.001 / M2 / FGSC 10212) TaxID=645133 RepID=E3QQ34_COLGM|nr:uncharacterized protein GLRG_08116 [Colletotrichum graminicola M1.001]EFQ32972.1 hypothetical protein GLRG_08116 [Colletotrichum graminicola M1.001]
MQGESEGIASIMPGDADIDLEMTIDEATYAILTLEVPPEYFNPDLATFFAERTTYNAVLASSRTLDQT